MLAELKVVRALPFNTGQKFSICRRLRQQEDFKQAFCAKRLTNKWFVVYARKNENGFARLGVVASKKVMPKATSRNFAKRLIRETFRREFPTENAVDIVVRVMQQIIPENSKNGHQALVQLFLSVQA